jgi:hypothetical protein
MDQAQLLRIGLPLLLFLPDLTHIFDLDGELMCYFDAIAGTACGWGWI